MGVPLIQEYGKSKIRLAIRELAEHIHSPQDQRASKDENDNKGVGSLLSKMFSRG